MSSSDKGWSKVDPDIFLFRMDADLALTRGGELTELRPLYDALVTNIMARDGVTARVVRARISRKIGTEWARRLSREWPANKRVTE